MKIDPLSNHMIVSLVGEEGLALADVVGELVMKIVAEMQEGYSLRFEVDRTNDFRDDVRVTVGRRDVGEVDFVLIHNDGDFELRPLQVNPAPIFR